MVISLSLSLKLSVSFLHRFTPDQFHVPVNQTSLKTFSWSWWTVEKEEEEEEEEEEGE